MLDRLRALFAEPPATRSMPSQEPLCAAVLMIELARADFDFAASERDVILQILAQRYQLSSDEVESLLDRALAEGDAAVSLHDYVRNLNARLDIHGRRQILAMLWQVAAADGRIDKYEEHTLRRMTELLQLSDADYIRIKLAVLEAAGVQ